MPHRGSLVFRIRQCHRLSRNRVVGLFMPAAGARPKEAKINLMDCICLCSEVEILFLSDVFVAVAVAVAVVAA